MAKFFIDRPIFAWVVALLILMGGLLAITRLPVSQYPSVAAPSIAITARYNGAAAKVLENSVTSIIEQQMTSLDGLLYMGSTSESSGQATITLYFQPGTNIDIAQVQVQNKLQLAMPRLPQTVQQQGVQVAKATRNYLLFATISSDDPRMREIDLGNYIYSTLLDPLRRVPGVGDTMVFGTEYAMRIWLDPNKLNSYKLMPSDIIKAIRAQNLQVSAGELGALPAVPGQQLNISLMAQGNLHTVHEFNNILLRVNTDGSKVRLADVARVQLAGQSMGVHARKSGKPAAAIGIKINPSANALATANAIHAKMKELSAYFPPGVKADFPYDTSIVIKISIEEVIKTLCEAIFLVFLVMYLFLQNLRATLIPTIVVPVALAGAFITLYFMNFSINVLTLFGMVLAIGLLVDDAIVVVENVERIMAEEGLSPREATRKAMEQITSALIGITLVLTAVFIPMAFFSGSVGAIYRQFSMSLVSSMLFSIFLALSLTPALCASLLEPVDAEHQLATAGFFGWFNRFFAKSSHDYQNKVAEILLRTGKYLIIFALIILSLFLLFRRMPSSFLPEEDQGYFITMVQLPVGATEPRTDKVMREMEKYFLAQPEVEQMISVVGLSFTGVAQNSGIAFIRLKDWSLRKGSQHSVQAVIGRSYMNLGGIKDAMIFSLNPPPIPEMGLATGFDFFLEDRANNGHEKLMQARNQLLGMAATNPVIAGMRPQGMEDAPNLQIDIDQEKASALGVSLDEINTTLSTAFGSSYVNDFVNGNRVQQVILQLDAPFRMLPSDINKLFVRNNVGTMVPFSAFTKLSWKFGSPRLEHFNGFPAREMMGSAAPGHSSGEAMKAIEQMVAKLPPGFGIEWTGPSYEERLSSSQAPALFAISLVVVFLALAALYESWSIPLAVMLVVPLGILGALLAATLRGLPNDVYFKVGLLATIGLSTKNAILIIEFAKSLQDQGMGLIEATLTAVKLRLRPILMTSMAFVLGVMPLVLSSGAGSASQHAIGTGVAGGMLSATFLAIFFVPIFFVVVRRIFPGKKDKS